MTYDEPSVTLYVAITICGRECGARARISASMSVQYNVSCPLSNSLHL